MASDYDIDKLILGGIITVVAVSGSMVATAMSSSSPIQDFGSLALVTVLYGVMMFASSYVEEEQHFWYWTTTAWLFCLVVNR